MGKGVHGMVTDEKQPLGGQHALVYRDPESQCCAPGTCVMLQADVTTIKRRRRQVDTILDLE